MRGLYTLIINYNKVMSEQSKWESAQEIPSNWFKFEKVGDEVEGTLINKTKRESSYGEQVVYELKQSNGDIINVGIRVSEKNYLNNKLRHVPYGKIIIFKFTKEVESKAFKGKMAKSIDAKILGDDENYSIADSVGGETVDNVDFTA
jgi:hypothetical protein